MMVSKVAVIALVLIVSCPILLGYGLNLSETTVTDYKANDDAVNVTQLLQNSSDHYSVSADVVSINTKWTAGSSAQGITIMPDFKVYGNTKTSIHLWKDYHSNSNWKPDNIYIQDFLYYDLYAQYDSNSCALNMTIHYNDSTPNFTINKLNTLNWDGKNKILTYATYDSGTRYEITSTSNFSYFGFATTGSYTANTQVHFNNVYWNILYVNLAAGYYVGKDSGNGGDLSTPSYSDILLTMDLNTISDSSYGFQMSTGYLINRIAFVKTTDADGVHWALYRVNSGYITTKITDLYYDQNRNSNTYQIYIDENGTDFRYVGDWPTFMGVANSYKHYYVAAADGYPNLTQKLAFTRLLGMTTGGTPLMRVDQAHYMATSYAIIENQTYEPAAFKYNPSTTISNPTKYGSSIEFGGVTYAVNDGKITLGSQQIPVKNLVLSSIPNDMGNYENKIGNTLISETAEPSTIVFNGKWSANITTASMDQYTYTKTEWTPGQFGWDGIDTNFLLVGMFTSLVAFIGLGIYARKHGGGVIPLMIVCGGAAVLFFCMI